MRNLIVVLIVFWFYNGTQAQKNQNDWFKSVQSGKLKVYKSEGGKFSESKKPWPFEVVKNGDQVEKVLLQRAGIIEEDFRPDLITYPAYFLFESQRIAGFENAIFYFTWKGEQATIKYALTLNESSISGSVQDWEKRLTNYQLQVLGAQGGARENLAEAKKEQEIAEKLANSIKNKQVKSVSVSWVELPKNIGHGTKLKYGIQATLSDGKILKTSTLGGKLPWDDFEITVQGAEFGEEQVAVEMDAKKIPNDKVVLTIKAKTNPSLTSSIEAHLNYVEKISLAYNAYQNGGYVVRNSGAHGKSAKNITISSNAYTTKNGLRVNKIEVVETATGTVLNRLKLHDDGVINLFANGEGGMSGRDNKRGGNGGNGGNVTIKKNAGSLLNVNIVNNGGAGGTHSSPLMVGNAGMKGQVSTLTTSTKFSW